MIREDWRKICLLCWVRAIGFGEFLCNTFTVEQFEVLGFESRRTLGPEKEGGLMVCQMPHFRIPQACKLKFAACCVRPPSQDAEKAFRKWKECPAFRRRVVAILTEESRGVATNMDYGRVVKWLREHFPAEEKYRVLVHAHAGDGNSQDVASVDAVSNGANGVWSAIIPQAAQAGHNSSLVFLDNLLKVGNPHVCTDYKIHRAAQCARHVYSLNFNTYDFPHDCPVWGDRARKQVHSAFSTVDGEAWRQKREDYFNVWGEEEPRF